MNRNLFCICACHFLFGVGISLEAQAHPEHEFLTEERTWTSSDGRTLVGRLVSIAEGTSNAAIVDGKVRVWVSGQIHDLPLERFSADDQNLVRKLSEAPAPTPVVEPTSAVSFPQVFAPKLVSRTFEGRVIFRDHSSHVLPSFSAPAVNIKDIKVSDGSKSSSEQLMVKIEISGSYFSEAARSLKPSPLRSVPGRLFVNGEESPSATFPLNPATGDDAETKTGTFDSLVDNIPISEGRNVFEVSIPDPVTLIEGGQIITIELDPSDLKLKKGEVAGSSPSGQIYPFFLVIEKVPISEAEGLKVGVGDPDAQEVFDLHQASPDGALLMTRAGSPEPAGFALLPSRKAAAPERIASLKQALEQIDANPALSERDQWLSGYGRGIFLHGADAVLADGKVLRNAAELKDDASELQLKARWLKDNVSSETFFVNLSPPFDSGSASKYTIGGSAELLWEISKLYRDGETTDEIPIAMLTGDYESIGLSHIPLSKWEEDFLVKISDPLHDMNSKLMKLSPFSHGVLVGMLTGVAAQIDLPPIFEENGFPDPSPRPTMSEILEHLVNTL